MEKQEPVPVKTSKEENGVENLTTASLNEDINDADYLKKMIDENPKNPLFLKKYAQFLFQVRLYSDFFPEARRLFLGIMLGMIQREI